MHARCETSTAAINTLKRGRLELGVLWLSTVVRKGKEPESRGSAGKVDCERSRCKVSGAAAAKPEKSIARLTHA